MTSICCQVHFPTLDESLPNYWAFREHPRWNDWWFPFFADGGGDFYVMDLDQREHGAIRRFRIEETELPIEFESLDRMLETVIAAYHRGAYYLGSSGYLEVDPEAYALIAREINPGVRWWE